MYIAHVIKSEVNSFTVDSVIGTFTKTWVVSSAIKEELLCHHDIYICNYHNPFAVATCKGMTIVGHVPRNL